MKSRHEYPEQVDAVCQYETMAAKHIFEGMKEEFAEEGIRLGRSALFEIRMYLHACSLLWELKRSKQSKEARRLLDEASQELTLNEFKNLTDDSDPLAPSFQDIYKARVHTYLGQADSDPAQDFGDQVLAWIDSLLPLMVANHDVRALKVLTEEWIDQEGGPSSIKPSCQRALKHALMSAEIQLVQQLRLTLQHLFRRNNDVRQLTFEEIGSRAVEAAREAESLQCRWERELADAGATSEAETVGSPFLGNAVVGMLVVIFASFLVFWCPASQRPWWLAGGGLVALITGACIGSVKTKTPEYKAAFNEMISWTMEKKPDEDMPSEIQAKMNAALPPWVEALLPLGGLATVAGVIWLVIRWLF